MPLTNDVVLELLIHAFENDAERNDDIPNDMVRETCMDCAKSIIDWSNRVFEEPERLLSLSQPVVQAYAAIGYLGYISARGDF